MPVEMRWAAASRAGPQVCSGIPVVRRLWAVMEGADWDDGARPFQCQSCDKKYLRKNNLEDHVLMEHPDTDQVARSARQGSVPG